MRAFFRELSIQFRSWRLERMRAAWRRKHYPVAMLPRQHGFSLLELMIAVGILGILLAVAIPAYASYTTKAAASEAINLAQSAEAAGNSAYQDSGGLTWPMTSADAGYANAQGKYVASVTFDGNGNLVATFGNSAPAALAGTTLAFQAWLAPDGQSITWTCGYANATAPTFGASTGVPAGTGTLLGAGTPATTTPAQFLPRNCRL